MDNSNSKEQEQDLMACHDILLELTDDSDLDDDDELEDIYYNELDVASVSDIHENPIEDPDSTTSASDRDRETEMIEPVPLPASMAPCMSVSIGSSSIRFALSSSQRPSDPNFADISGRVSEDLANSSRSHAHGHICPGPGGLRTTLQAMRSRRRGSCHMCQQPTLQNFVFCNRCFRSRRNWLPPRPKPRQGKRKRGDEPHPYHLQRATRNSRLEISINSPANTTINSNKPTEMEMEGETSLSLSQGLSMSNSNVDAEKNENKVNFNEAFLISENISNSGVSRLTDSLNDNTDVPEELLDPAAVGNFQTDVDKLESKTLSSAEQLPGLESIGENSKVKLNDAIALNAVDATDSKLKDSDENKTNPKELELCNVCCVKVKDAAFVHNKIAHMFGCFSCADRILKRDGKCPICRDRVLRVVKVLDT